MPRYKYSCAKCELEDIKQFTYVTGKENQPITLRLCKICGGLLKRDFLKPPQEWMNQQRQNR